VQFLIKISSMLMMDDQKADLYGELPAFQKEVLG